MKLDWLSSQVAFLGEDRRDNLIPTLKADLLVLLVFMGTAALRLRDVAIAMPLPLVFPPFTSWPLNTVASSSGKVEEEPFINEDLSLVTLTGELELASLEFSSSMASVEPWLFFSLLLDGASLSFNASSSELLLVPPPW